MQFSIHWKSFIRKMHLKYFIRVMNCKFFRRKMHLKCFVRKMHLKCFSRRMHFKILSSLHIYIYIYIYRLDYLTICMILIIKLYIYFVCTWLDSWWLATGQWFSSGTLVSSTNKTDIHDITEILFKVLLNTINQTKPSNT